MSIRKPVPDAAVAELARRRLSLLGAELSPSHPAPRAGAPVAGTAREADEGAAPCDGAAAATRGSGDVRAGGGRHARARLSWGSRLLGRVVDGLPPALHGRLGITAQHVTVVALTLGAAMAVAAWLLVRSTPDPLPQRASLVLPESRPGPDAVVPQAVAPVPADVSAGGPVPAATSAPVAASGTSPQMRLVVHVAGKVRRPGVVELPSGSRVIDAIDAAGGPRPGVRLDTVNLARLLVDGEQIAVGVPVAVAASAAPGSAVPTTPVPSGSAAGSPVNLNTADQAELEELPGVGPVTASSIIEWRTQHGGFTTVDELIEVSGIGEVTLAELRDLVTV